jgi:hypothetical protein
MYQLVVW